MNIKSHDQVIILHGKDRGKKGTVVVAMPGQNKVVVEKINMVKRHSKPQGSAARGGIIEKELPLDVAKVMLICPHCGKSTRVGHVLAHSEKYVRICMKCKQVIDVKKS